MGQLYAIRTKPFIFGLSELCQDFGISNIWNGIPEKGSILNLKMIENKRLILDF
jgi:hypothetical protein